MTEPVSSPVPQSRSLRYRSTVFLDRDGTINVKAPEGRYVTAPSELVLLPGAAQAVAKLNAASVRVILVTNQRWLSALPDLSPYKRVHAHLQQLLAAENAHLDAAYFCPHDAGSCICRKPQPGLLERAGSEHGFQMQDAVMIGDQETDVTAGRAAGAASILLRSAESAFPTAADYVVADLAEAVRLVLQDGPSAELVD
jgi:D-glycero-D-manno-heptose 1,7-bisphosphate phosphatase